MKWWTFQSKTINILHYEILWNTIENRNSITSKLKFTSLFSNNFSPLTTLPYKHKFFVLICNVHIDFIFDCLNNGKLFNCVIELTQPFNRISQNIWKINQELNQALPNFLFATWKNLSYYFFGVFFFIFFFWILNINILKYKYLKYALKSSLFIKTHQNPDQLDCASYFRITFYY